MAAGVRSEPYSREILRLAASLPEAAFDDTSDARTTLRSDTCGSTIDLAAWTDSGTVERLEAAVSACAYGQAASALMLRHAPGRTIEDIERALIEIDDWLEGSDAIVPEWPEIEALAPARERPGRHGAIMLPFRALLRALQEAGA